MIMMTTVEESEIYEDRCLFVSFIAVLLCVFIPEMTQKEHLTRQKQLLNKTLGLDSDIGLANIGDELFKEEDLIIETSSVQASAPQVLDDYDIIIMHFVYISTDLHCTGE